MKKFHIKKLNPFFAIMFLILVFYAFILISMSIWGVLNSFKDQWEFRADKIGLPEVWHFENYSLVLNTLKIQISKPTGFTMVTFAQMYVNSFLYAVGCGFTSTLIPCLTAYLVAKYSFKLSKIIYAIVGSTPSALQMAKTFGLYDSIVGQWIMSANFLGGVYFLIFYESFHMLPEAYREAAEIDGASRSRIMITIIFPLVRSMFLTVFLLKVISLWNDYKTPLLYIPSYPTISYGLFEFSFNTTNELAIVPIKLSASFLVCIPTLLLFLVFQKRLMEGVTLGGIKG